MADNANAPDGQPWTCLRSAMHGDHRERALEAGWPKSRRTHVRPKTGSCIPLVVRSPSSTPILGAFLRTTRGMLIASLVR